MAEIDVNELKAAYPVAEYCAHRGIKLREAGAEMRGHCPMCGVTSSDPFAVKGEKWRCNACDAKGNIIDLCMLLEGITFRAAGLKVEELAGIEGEDEATRSARTEVSEAIRAAQAGHDAQRRATAAENAPEYWRQLTNSEAHYGNKYLRARQVGSARADVKFAPTVICIPLRAVDGTIVNVVRRRCGGGPGPKVFGLKGCTTLGTFGDIRQAKSSTGPVIIVEGVFDWLSARVMLPDALVLGAHGAGRLPDVVGLVIAVAKERGLLFVPHADEIGAKKVEQAIAVARAAGVRNIQRMDLATGDLNDFLMAGGTGAQLLAAPMVPDDGPTFALTQLGNAERFAFIHQDGLRYLPTKGQWLVWNENIWEDGYTETHLVRAAKKTIKHIAAEDTDAAGKWSYVTQQAKHINAMVNLARASEELETSQDRLNVDHFLLACKNGTLDLRTGKLRASRQTDLITVCSPVTFDADAKCPRWDRFVAEIFQPHPDAAEFCQRYAGYSLTGDTSAQCLLFAHGSGANGKGTFFKVMQAILGRGLRGQLPMELFVVRTIKKANEEYLFASCSAARAVFVSEGKKGERFDNELVNRLTGEDVVNARHPYGRPFEYQPQFKLWMASNWLPAIDADDYALWRRFMLVPFAVRFEGKRRDGGLIDALLAELPGILVWAVRGCRDWLAAGGGIKGLGQSTSVAEATNAYRTESDDIGRFVEECCAIGPNIPAARVDALFTRYQRWAHEQGKESYGKAAFGADMKARGLASFRHGHGGKYYYPVGLQAECDE